MLLCVYGTILKFIAMNNTCTMIYTYYEKLPEGQTVPKASGQCTFTRIIYASWFTVCLAITMMRLFGLTLMMRTRKFLSKKLEEKEKRKIYRREKKKKEKRNRKRHITNLIEEKKNV